MPALAGIDEVYLTGRPDNAMVSSFTRGQPRQRGLFIGVSGLGLVCPAVKNNEYASGYDVPYLKSAIANVSQHAFDKKPATSL
jgi:hypothetical protein